MTVRREVLVTLAVVVLAVASGALMYSRYETKPWTRDAQVQANVVGIASRVEGPVVRVAVRDNQPVKKGDLLFEIDPATFQAAVENAQARLSQAEAAVVQAQQDLARQDDLYKSKTNDLRDLQNAQDAFTSAQANAAAAKATLDLARLNLGYTQITAPVDGYVTNMNTSPGTYVHVGEEITALVDASSFWIAAYFKETQLGHVKPGGKVTVRLMGHSSQPFEGRIDSVGWGIFVSDGSTVQLLPAVQQTVDWVRLPNRFPVRVLATGTPPVPLRIGQTASVSVQGE